MKTIPIHSIKENEPEKVSWEVAPQKQWVKERELADREKSAKEKPIVYEKSKNYIKKAQNGEPIPLITLNYDYLCNFQCDHCCADLFMNKTAAAEKADTRRKLTPQDVKMIADQADEIGIGQFTLSGGEPLTYKAFDDVLKAIGPERFYIATDTNAWFLSKEKAQHLKKQGLDKIQISLDSFIEKEHDMFRKKKGSYKKIMEGIVNAKNANLKVIIMTCLTKDRTYSQEFKNMLEWGKKVNVGIYVTYAKPVGAWEGDTSEMCGNKEFVQVKKYSEKYDVFTRTSGGHGLDIGCIAVKRNITITKYGDVMPCPYIHLSIGNIFVEKLSAILNRGLRIKHFSYGEVRTCLSGNKDHYFVKEYMPKIRGKVNKDGLYEGTIPYQKVFDSEDFVDGIVS
ncbi:radical SAM protein [Nitrosomonadales bacterium]|nr:radical SAM protein [Nitrosomonadales bacterium]